MAEGTKPNWVRAVGSAVVLALAAYVLWRVRGAVITVLLALVMAYVLRPLVTMICQLGVVVRKRKCRMPRGAATGVVFVLLAVALWSIWVVSSDSIRRQIVLFQERWPSYQAALMKQVAALEVSRENLSPAVRKTVDSWQAGLTDSLTEGLKRGLGATARSVGFLIELVLVPILAFYFLADGPGIRKQALFFVPRRYLAWTDHALVRSDDAFQRFIRGQVVLCLIAFAVVTIGLWALRVDYYLLLGLVAGLTRAIPILGPVAGAIPIIIVILATKDTAVAFWVVLAFTLMHLLESKLLMPTILGHELKLHPVLIIISLLVGAQLGGLLGMFLAAPVLAVIRALVADQRHTDENGEPLSEVEVGQAG